MSTPIASRVGYLFAALLVVTSLVLSPKVQAEESSAEASKLLESAKTSAFQLKRDAAVMESYRRSKVSWQSHATQIASIKKHVNDIGEVLRQLEEVRHTAAPWQQESIDRITPLLKELASSTEGVIDGLNERPRNLHLPVYMEYLVANRDLAAELAALVQDFVEYGKTKEQLAKLHEKLGVGSK